MFKRVILCFLLLINVNSFSYDLEVNRALGHHNGNTVINFNIKYSGLSDVSSYSYNLLNLTELHHNDLYLWTYPEEIQGGYVVRNLFGYNLLDVSLEDKEKYVNTSLELIKKKITIDKNLPDFVKVNYIATFVINNFNYPLEDKLVGNDKFKYNGLYTLFKTGEGTCGASAKLVSELLTEYGVRNTIVINKTHAWNGVWIDGEPFHLDVSNLIGLMGYKLMKDSDMEIDWDKNLFTTVMK